VDGAFQEATLQPIPFWFLRHGETDWNAQGISQGNVDIPLNKTGIAQARAAAQKLRNRGIATIVSSPLSRARVTAELVGEVLGLPVASDPDLREVAFGVQEGQKMSGWFAEWIMGAFTPDSAESFATLRRRAIGAANRATAQPPAVLVVAHGALFRSLRAAMDIQPNTRTQNAVPIFCEPPNGSGSNWTLRPVV
jgi:2,3-bisphosphoglycerate-dependent phosphoglycerate mutase